MKVVPSCVAAAPVPAQAAPSAVPASPQASPGTSAPEAPAAHPARLDASGLFSADVRAAADDRRFLASLADACGRDFDAAIEAAWELGRARAERILRAAAAGCITAMPHETEELPIVDQLRNYERRLRVLRLLVALDALPGAEKPRKVQLLYPVSGVDVLPSLFFPDVKAIDWGIEPRAIAADWRPCRQPMTLEHAIRAEGEKSIAADHALRALFEKAAAEPFRHHPIQEDVFSLWLPQLLHLEADASRLLFLKGLEWLIPPASYVCGGLDRERGAAIAGVADQLTRKGDTVALWDALPALEAKLLADGRYERWQPHFLDTGARARLEGAAIARAQCLVSLTAPANQEDGALGDVKTFVIPRFLRLFRRIA